MSEEEFEATATHRSLEKPKRLGKYIFRLNQVEKLGTWPPKKTYNI